MNDAEEAVSALLGKLGARAAGLWRVEGRELVQVAFVPCRELPADVASAFSQATVRVPVDQADLGIVRAFRSNEPIVSLAADLPAESGSGRWLRAFGACRSVAVPLADPAGAVAAVLSVALSRSDPPAREVAATLRDHAQRLGLDRAQPSL